MQTIAELKQKLELLDTYIRQSQREIDERNLRLNEKTQEREDIAAEIAKLEAETELDCDEALCFAVAKAAGWCRITLGIVEHYADKDDCIIAVYGRFNPAENNADIAKAWASNPPSDHRVALCIGCDELWVTDGSKTIYGNAAKISRIYVRLKGEERCE